MGGDRRGVPRSRAAREEARRLQAERERAEARRRILRRTIAAGIALAVLLMIAGAAVLLHRPDAEERALIDASAAAARSAGCTGVRVIPAYPREGLDRTHVGGSDQPSMPPLSSYASVPPVSGPHDPTPLDAGVYGSAPPIGRALHSLEHAAVIVWYHPALAEDPELRRIRAFFARGDQRNHVIVAPYAYPDQGVAGSLPAGVGVAFAAWHRLQTCARPSLAAAYGFVDHYRFDLYRWTAYRGDAPEKFAPI